MSCYYPIIDGVAACPDCEGTGFVESFVSNIKVMKECALCSGAGTINVDLYFDDEPSN